MIQFIQNNNDLKLNHQNETPLFEKINIPPDYGSRLVSRVYTDGSLYYLSQARESDSSMDMNESWNFISTVSASGINKIRKTLAKCCEIKSNVKPGGNIKGAVIWNIQCKNELHEIV
ncbi:MAG: hypothetical protein HQ522_07265, partial [Bacteroidetes bacterium]|nr:hypothetical protein [Bacteroidota bacterium]